MRAIMRNLPLRITTLGCVLALAVPAWAQDEELPPDGAPMDEAPMDEAAPEEPPPGEPMPPPAAAPTADEQPAAAGGPSLLGPGTRPFFGGLSLGGGIKLSKSVGQFKLMQEFGWHVLSGTFEGLAVGLALGESFGDNWTIFQMAPKAWWHFLVLPQYGLYVGPFLQLGFAYASISVDAGPLGSVSSSDTSFNWQFGVDGVLMLADRFYVLFRPFGLDLNHADGGTGIRWDLQIGGGVTF